MRTIREFEERLHREFATGEIPGFVHLYAGEEAIAAGVCAHLAPDDYVASTHRGHGHAIAKGCDVKGDDGRDLRQARPASATARAARCTSPTSTKGMLGANGIVGGGPPLVCGVGLTAKVKRHRPGRRSPSPATAAPTRARSWRASTSPSAWHLPCVFVVENNGYAEATSRALPPGRRRRRQARRRLRHARRQSSTASTSSPSTRRPARRSRAPAPAAARRCSSARSCRYFGHFEGDQQTYRGAGEVEELRARRATAWTRSRAA